jgi:hypothetical protein
MKHTAAIALFLVASFISAASASAQDHRVKVTVPFNFTVGDQALPSGTYMIGSQNTNPAILEIRNWDKHVHILTLAQPSQRYAEHDNALVFHKYGGEYFLSDIRTENSSMNVHFPTTKAEKKARARNEEAGLFPSDPVLIALD